MSREYRAARNARKRGIPTGRRVGGPGLQGGPTGWASRVGLQGGPTGGPTGWAYRVDLQGELVGWAVRCKSIAPTGRSAGLVPPGNAGAWGNRARRRVGGPGLQGGPTGWTYRMDLQDGPTGWTYRMGLQGEAVGGAVRCKPIAPTGRSAGLVPSGNAGAWGNRAGRRVRRPGLHGGLIGDTHP